MQYDVAKLIGSHIKHLPDLSCWARTCKSARDACRDIYQTALQRTFYVVGRHDMILDPYSTACWTNFKNLQLSRGESVFGQGHVAVDVPIPVTQIIEGERQKVSGTPAVPLKVRSDTVMDTCVLCCPPS